MISDFLFGGSKLASLALRAVRRCRRLASAPGAARLLFYEIILPAQVPIHYADTRHYFQDYLSLHVAEVFHLPCASHFVNLGLIKVGSRGSAVQRLSLRQLKHAVILPATENQPSEFEVHAEEPISF